MVYAALSYGVFVVRGLLDGDLSAVGAVEVDETLTETAHLVVAVEGDAGAQVALLHVEHHMVLLIMLCYFHCSAVFNGLFFGTDSTDLHGFYSPCSTISMARNISYITWGTMAFP